jgi:hypothetical protein
MLPGGSWFFFAKEDKLKAIASKIAKKLSK